MKLYNSIGPNPKVVRVFMAERAISLPMEEIDLMKGANRGGEFLKVNPAGQLPALILDDGSVVTEITAICEYLDETQPGDRLMGHTAEARAQNRRWTRWVDLNVCEPLANGFRFSEGLQLFQNRMRCLPEAAPGLKACAQDKLAWLDEHMMGRDFISGNAFSLPDILLSSFLMFGESVGQPINPDLKQINAWLGRVKARPSIDA